MPSCVIHEEVGYYLSKKLNLNSYDYYLGLLAPDSPNYKSFAEKNVRWIAHQRSSDYNEWRNNIKKLYSKEITNYSKDFILGYYIHILTDIIYDEFIYLKVRKKIIDEGISLDNSHNEMSSDMEKYSFIGIKDVINILNSSDKTYDILNISKDIMTLWKERKLVEFNMINNSKYITEDIINELNEMVYEEVKNT